MSAPRCATILAGFLAVSSPGTPTPGAVFHVAPDGQRVLPDASGHHEGRAALLALSSDAPAGGKRCLKMMDVPTGVWFRIEVAAGLGGDATGTWDLTVTLPGQAPKTFAKLPVGSRAWKKLDWLGFCSVATQPTTIWLDNLELTNPSAQ